MNSDSQRTLAALLLAAVVVGGGFYALSRILPGSRARLSPETRNGSESSSSATARKSVDRLAPKWALADGAQTRPAKRVIQHDSRVVYCLPFLRSNSFFVSQAAGGPTHTGENLHAIDFPMNVGTPIHAARAGVVRVAEDHFDQRGQTREMASRANRVVIEHEDGTLAVYAHLERGGVRVNSGEKVAKGQVIGRSGNTGFTTGPHLHFVVSRPLGGDKFESVPVIFMTSDGPQSLETGKRYSAPVVCD